MNEFTPADVALMRRALRYWVQKWDWETELLLGVGRAELTGLSEADDQLITERLAFAAHGAIRELLCGASAASTPVVESVLGVESAEATRLLDRLSRYGV